jgi:hypothetical protein
MAFNRWTAMLLACILIAAGCSNRRTLFEKVSSEVSGIRFNNVIIENDSVNPLDLTNIYNGGGVGLGDFNNDGLQDIYFTGNTVENKLYLNKGDFKFRDVTGQSGVNGQGRWCRGVSIIDINNDGWLDMYVSATILPNPAQRQNLLYINKGADSEGVPHFEEKAAEYGLNDTTHSTMAAFFDYDNDSDLDMYLVVNEVRQKDNPSVFRPRITDGSHYSTGRLYRNDWNDSLGHAFFTNVTAAAHVTAEGYGHAVSIADFNLDGWKDFFVTNDFLGNDLLYINNRNGTFTDKAAQYFKHTSANGMGQDVIDINNDGLSDIIELDMNPEDNFRKKMMMGSNNYNTYQNSDYYGYQYQYVRNTLQLNQGFRVLENDSLGDPIFSDIAYFAGIAETDWSWAPLVQDFDNDGLRDIIVTNGYPKDVTDHDFIIFRSQSSAVASKQYLLSQIPQVKIHNYAFRNNGNLSFSNATNDWGFADPSFANGASYADLDNDGDLDVVINNINDEAGIYRNTLRDNKKSHHNYLQLRLRGDSLNRLALGTWVEIYYGDSMQAYEMTTARGYLSSIQINPHFGLGNTDLLDSVCIKWPDGKKQLFAQVKTNQVLQADHKNATQSYSWSRSPVQSLFKEITASTGIQYMHQEDDFVDFNVQKLIPHKFSEYGPALAGGDLDGNGLDDIVCGGSRFHSAMLFLQLPDGKFISKELLPGATEQTKPWEDMGIVIFDADGDKDPDLYITSGGYENAANSAAYGDKLYLNDGRAGFTMDTTAMPQNFTSKSCVRATDYDKDGDLDLFIAGRVLPAQYPAPVAAFIYRNDTKDGKIKFSDITASAAPALNQAGLVSDALWTDFNNDGWQDLVLAGEWMPLTFLQNEKGVFKNITAQTGLQNQKGWWTSVVSGDFDNDGDIDYVAGNLGLNSFYKANAKYPVRLYAKDFDKNGSYDAVPTLYLPATLEDTSRKEFAAHTRDDMVKQIVGFRAKYPGYKAYANATIDQMFTKEELQDVLKMEANNFSHCFIKNLGNGKFEMTPMPYQTQFSCLNGMVADDFDGDGNIDLAVTGNDYGTEVTVGRYDACNGLLLMGRGDGGFSVATMEQSGIFVPGNGKSMINLKGSDGKYLLAASQNRGPLKIFLLKKQMQHVALAATDVQATIKLKNGRTQLRDLNYGASFLSQSGRFLTTSDNVLSLSITNSTGETRTIR